MKQNHKLPDKQILYSCPDDQVHVVRKFKQVGRNIRYVSPGVLFELSTQIGSRVRRTKTGIEYMPSFDELRAMLVSIDPTLAQVIPDTFKNKPRQRQLKWRYLNSARLSSGRTEC